jgi:hypothetical protein
LRRTEKALQPGNRFDVIELGDDGLALLRDDTAGHTLLLVAWLQGSGAYEHSRSGPIMPGDRWRVVLSTEEPRFQESPDRTLTFAPDIELEEAPVVRFRRPSAVILSRQ